MHPSLDSIESAFPKNWPPDRLARAKTTFYKTLALEAHRAYAGKIQVLPRAPLPDFHWLNAWYTPGVSAVSTAIRDNNDASFDLSWRGNAVAIISDSTRVLGDGNVTPPGGLGVMEGKAFLMKILGGIDAVPLCVDSRGPDGKNNPEILIRLVKRLAPSFGAINLEDIQQPHCFRVLDGLRGQCGIPVWHDDAQGTGCVTLAALLNALQVAQKQLQNVRIVFVGAGAANTTICRLLIQTGANPASITMFDSHGALHAARADIAANPAFYRKWEIAQTTNPAHLDHFDDAIKNADVLISLSRPGPNAIHTDAIRRMAPRAIVFACANPIPEIYPHAATAAGALVVATGRGDFPNQVNNSLGFPGVLKGALLVRAREITDPMAIAAAQAIAAYARKTGLSPTHIIPTMSDSPVFAETAEAVAQQAIAENLARRPLPPRAAFHIASQHIASAQAAMHALQTHTIPPPPSQMIQRALQTAIRQTPAN